MENETSKTAYTLIPDKYRAVAGKYDYTLEVLKTSKEKDKKYWAALGHYPNLSQVVQATIENCIHSGESATTLQEFLGEYTALVNIIEQVFDPVGKLVQRCEVTGQA